MDKFTDFLDSKLSDGQRCFTSKEAISAVGSSPRAFASLIGRQRKKRRVARAQRGFYLILRPEDWAMGAPDPAGWIAPLMRYQGVDYRVSLLRAAAFHGASRQAAMVFQVVAPKQFRDITIGRQHIQFLYQEPAAFAKVNRPEWLGQIRSYTGFANVAGPELTLFDSVRYFHKAGGLNGVAQMVRDIGAKTTPKKLTGMAPFFENSCLRRLGYLFELCGYARQAAALEPFAARAKSAALLNPSVRPTVMKTPNRCETSNRWSLILNEAVEIEE